MSKIIIINDNSWYGGAEITNNSIMAEGLNRDHEVEVYVYGKREREGGREFKPDNADMYIIANYGYIPTDALLKFISNNKYVRFFHDIPGFISAIPSSFSTGNEGVLSQLINKAQHNFMISPMQYGVIESRIELPKDKITIVPPYIPLNEFKDKGEDRVKDSWLYLGDVSPARGVTKSIEVAIQNNAKEFIIVGPQVQAGYVDFIEKRYGEYVNITYLGQVKYAEVNDIMNKYENFIYTPEIYDSFCRKVVEAQAAGMMVHVDNKRIGVYSYPKDYNMKDGILTSNLIVWDKIDSLLKDVPIKDGSSKDSTNSISNV